MSPDRCCVTGSPVLSRGCHAPPFVVAMIAMSLASESVKRASITFGKGRNHDRDNDPGRDRADARPVQAGTDWVFGKRSAIRGADHICLFRWLRVRLQRARP